MKKDKKEPWRMIVFILSVIFIIFLWVQKDIVDICKSVPTEQIVPMIITSVLVTILKMGLLAGAVLLVKWVVDKIKHKKG